MLLITEDNFSDFQYLTEEKDGKKSYFIEGILMTHTVKNRNGRIYPKDILLPEAKRYVSEMVSQRRAFGELGHPEGPVINMDRVSHIMESMTPNGNDIIGKAKVIDTPMGNIVKTFIDEKAKLGVSTRGLGNVKHQSGADIVQSGFRLSAIDIVHDPSAATAFVNGIMEGKEWVWEGDSLVEQGTLEKYKRIIERTSHRRLAQKKLDIFEDFLQKIELKIRSNRQ